MSSSIATTATPAQHAFERRVEDVSPCKSDINGLIFDYLTAEGYPLAAVRFSQEANLRPLQLREMIEKRSQIKLEIHAGSIKSAIEATNELSPEILDSDPALHFALLRLQLIELIRETCYSSDEQNFAPAIAFASTYLAPRASTNTEFLDALEKTMALILFPPDQLEPQLEALLAPSMRKDVADRVNRAILSNQKQRREAAIRDLVRLRQWAEDTARSNKKDLPVRLDIGLAEDQVEDDRGEPMEL